MGDTYLYSPTPTALNHIPEVMSKYKNNKSNNETSLKNVY